LYLTLAADLYRSAPSELPGKQRKALRRKFKALIYCSELVHEGLATAAEFHNVLASQGDKAADRMIASLPRTYHKAVSRFKPIALSILSPLSEATGEASFETIYLVLEGIARACMDNSIFESLGSPDAFWDYRFVSFVWLSENSPNERLRMLAKYVDRHSGFGATLVSRLERSGVLEKMRQLRATSSTHLELVRQRFVLSKSIFRTCIEMIQETNLFSVDDIVSRDNADLLRRAKALSSSLLKSIGVEDPPKLIEMGIDDWLFPAVHVRHSSYRSLPLDEVSATTFLQRLPNYQSGTNSGSESCWVILIWPDPDHWPQADRLKIEILQVKTEPGEGGRLRIKDMSEDETIAAFLCSPTVGELIEITNAVARSPSIAATHALAWHLLPQNVRTKLSGEAGTPIFVYQPALNIQEVRGWASADKQPLPVDIVAAEAISVEGGELFRGALVTVGPSCGQRLVRFGLIISADYEQLLKDAMSQSGIKLGSQWDKVWSTQVTLANWIAVKFFATEQFDDDRWMASGLS
jgi:hypothetical protein